MWGTDLGRVRVLELVYEQVPDHATDAVPNLGLFQEVQGEPLCKTGRVKGRHLQWYPQWQLASRWRGSYDQVVKVGIVIFPEPHVVPAPDLVDIF